LLFIIIAGAQLLYSDLKTVCWFIFVESMIIFVL